ncbi:MAG: purine-binding chemotaxis protein CheW [Deferribacteres bacterium]|nr:purine-binding chemotaxis protein CheW [candidate division KSB1 bacterium]MCB9502883.1 purine-binding chemotaxis protein CheW [Deferribacteres bacterium]
MSDNTQSQINQYLTFSLDSEIFAQSISEVREVLEYATITRIPKTPEFMLGVINLRGNAVPVIDMRLKLGLPKTERTVDTCIIITEVQMEEGENIFGALVDSVHEVMEIDQDTLEPTPKIGTKIDSSFIRGMAKQDDGFIMLLDIVKIFSDNELNTIQKTTEDQIEEEKMEVLTT